MSSTHVYNGGSQSINFKLIYLVIAPLILCYLIWKLSLYVKIRYNMYKLTKHEMGPGFVELFSYVLRFGRNPDVFNLNFDIQRQFHYPFDSVDRAKDFLNVAMEIAKKYFPTCVFWIGDTVHISISDPQDLQIILNHPQALEKAYTYDYFTRLFGKGLFTAPLHTWKNTRKAASPFFSNKNLNNIVDMVCERANAWIETDFKEAFEKNATFDMYDVVKLFTFSVNLEAATGVQFKMDTVEHLEELSKKGLTVGFERSCKLHLHPQPVFEMTSTFKNLTSMEDDFIGLLEEAVTRKRRDHTGKPQDNVYNDFLIKQSKQKECLSADQIRDEVLTFVNAGYDTVATTISFLLWMLGMDQDAQQKVYEETMEILGPTNAVTPNDLPHFTYLDMAIKETLRLFPPAPFQMRHTHTDIKLKTCTVPSGAVLIFPTIQKQRDERIWPNPMKFEPERFLPEEAQKQHPYSYTPFMAGPRNCLGKKFGMMMVKAVVPGIIRKYKIHAEVRPIETIRLKTAIIIESADGYKMTLELRK